MWSIAVENIMFLLIDLLFLQFVVKLWFSKSLEGEEVMTIEKVFRSICEALNNDSDIEGFLQRSKSYLRYSSYFW